MTPLVGQFGGDSKVDSGESFMRPNDPELTGARAEGRGCASGATMG
jgi:hypothetical protein